MPRHHISLSHTGHGTYPNPEAQRHRVANKSMNAIAREDYSARMRWYWLVTIVSLFGGIVHDGCHLRLTALYNKKYCMTVLSYSPTTADFHRRSSSTFMFQLPDADA